MNETWASISEFPQYQISSLGRIRRSKPDKRNHQCKILRTYKNKTGYERINIYSGSKYCMRYIHRLVAENFISPIPKNKQVNHIDGNKLNNVSTNLEIVTPKENNSHGRKHGLIKNAYNVKLNKDAVLKIRSSRKSLRYLSKIYNTSISNISSIKRGKTWKKI